MHCGDTPVVKIFVGSGYHMAKSKWIKNSYIKDFSLTMLPELPFSNIVWKISHLWPWTEDSGIFWPLSDSTPKRIAADEQWSLHVIVMFE